MNWIWWVKFDEFEFDSEYNRVEVIELNLISSSLIIKSSCENNWVEFDKLILMSWIWDVELDKLNLRCWI